ncbi:phospholipase D family protein [Vibrio maerlii]|uniref:phospholipase D family protein n=1 Tax=Vibrio maerlii TaxID=2231648 RepID=UPI000E3D34EA|nr:phospholipase D family protein [Vibrio maerlii]
MYKSRRVPAALLSLLVLAGCSSLPEQMEHTTVAQEYVSDSRLSELVNTQKPQVYAQNKSAVLIQEKGWDALAQRLALIDAAEQSIDIQYYIWNSDKSGAYMVSRLVAAADRGVKVRLLLDDINLNEREDLLIALDSHPNIRIRIYNPIPTRSGVAKWLNVLGDFSRLNRRMHNKSFTVDGVFSVVGGRNIGDEYFDLSEEINFRDRDALITGEVVSDIQLSYLDYWDSSWSYPVELLGSEAASLSEYASISVPEYLNYPPLPVGEVQSLKYLKRELSNMELVDALYVSDHPVPEDTKNVDEPKATAILLGELASKANEEIILESAYMVLDDTQLDFIQGRVGEGVEMKALTNSMASNDLVTNHSGYAGRRQDMLEHGIQLFELKPETRLCNRSTRDDAKCAPTLPYGLHAKSAVFDQRYVAIGSFNFNLRSTYLNTESILVFESEEIADQLVDVFEEAMEDDNSWRLELEDGTVYWHSQDETWDSEPEVGRWEQLQSRLLQFLPIEKYL